MHIKEKIKLLKKFFKEKNDSRGIKIIFGSLLLFISLFLFIAIAQTPQEIRQRAQVPGEEEGSPNVSEIPEPPLCAAKLGFCTPVADGCLKADNIYEGETDFGQMDCSGGHTCCGLEVVPTAPASASATAIPTTTYPTNTPLPNPTTLPLTVGDVNGDKILSALDYNDIVNCYNTTTPTASCNVAKKQKTDLNIDGKIDGVDINIFLRAAK